MINSGEISCNYENSEASVFPECKKSHYQRERNKDVLILVIIQSSKFLREGHFYLDRDKDGEACEFLLEHLVNLNLKESLLKIVMMEIPVPQMMVRK